MSAATHAPLLHFGFRCDRTVLQPSQNQKGFVRRDEIALHVVERGGVRVVLATGDRIDMLPHRLWVSWGAIPHRPEWLYRDTVIYCLTIPLAWVLRWELPTSFISALLAGRALAEAETLEGKQDEHTMRRWVALLAERDDETGRIVLLEAEARLRRLARTSQPAGSQLSTAHSTTVERAIQLIAKRFADPLNVPALAGELGLHPNYLSTLFKRETGQTLSCYLAEYRLAHACALLVSTNDQIVDIAYSAGFGSVSQFHTLFRRHRGTSPRQYRLARRPEGSV